MTARELIDELSFLSPDTPVTACGREPDVVWRMEGGMVVGADICAEVDG